MATGPLYYPTHYLPATTQKKVLSATAIGALCLFLASSIWGVNFAVSKAVLAEVAPMPLLVIRFAIAFVLFLAIALPKTSLKIPASEMALLAIIGLIGFPLSIGALFIGAARIDASLIGSSVARKTN
jgi:drug/metabolite transporter (DMT)-like permease